MSRTFLSAVLEYSFQQVGLEFWKGVGRISLYNLKCPTCGLRTRASLRHHLLPLKKKQYIATLHIVLSTSFSNPRICRWCG